MFWFGVDFRGLHKFHYWKNCIVKAYLLLTNFSKGMEIWNPIDGSVQMIFKEIPPEYGQSRGQKLIKTLCEHF